MQDATLCFIMREKPRRQVLLGMKKKGFGAGKYNGFGGKVKDGETVAEAAARELHEECGIKVDVASLEKLGELTFLFPTVPEDRNWNQVVHVFVASQWHGEPGESDEMRPEWFDIGRMPYQSMWKDDPHWMPYLLGRKSFKGRFVFDGTGESITEMSVGEAKGGF